jgi:hypothetical protein
MVLPSLEVIEEVGDGVKALADIPTLAAIDTLVWTTIRTGKMPCCEMCRHAEAVVFKILGLW